SARAARWLATRKKAWERYSASSAAISDSQRNGSPVAASSSQVARYFWKVSTVSSGSQTPSPPRSARTSSSALRAYPTHEITLLEDTGPICTRTVDPPYASPDDRSDRPGRRQYVRASPCAAPTPPPTSPASSSPPRASPPTARGCSPP